jgi:valyl-tRNA synthetase
MNLSIKRVEANRNFANKIWNAARFVISALQSTKLAWPEDKQRNGGVFSSLSPIPYPLEYWTLADRWIFARLQALVRDVERLFQSYQYGEAGRQIYEFFWNEFADWYVEIAKLQLSKGENASVERGPRANLDARIADLITLQLLAYVLDTCLRLLHPFTPFITEELWGHLKRVIMQSALPYRLTPEALITAPWPEPRPEEMWEQDAVAQFTLVQDVVRSIRNLRAERNVKPGRRISARIVAGERAGALQTQAATIATLAQLDRNTLAIEESAPARMVGYVALVVSGVEIYLPLAGLVDVEEERLRLENELADMQRQAQRLEQLLAGPFAQKAPPAVVQKEREKLAVIHETMQKLVGQLESLS